MMTIRYKKRMWYHEPLAVILLSVAVLVVGLLAGSQFRALEAGREKAALIEQINRLEIELNGRELGRFKIFTEVAL